MESAENPGQQRSYGDSLGVQCNSSKNTTNVEIVLTVAMVIGKVELSATKTAATQSSNLS